MCKKNMDELISVIIPVYNVEKYVERCILSVCNQTYKKLEIIIVDDGSNDKSGSICDKYAQIDRRIKVFHKENGGLSSARNFGIKQISGAYVSFIDGDDWIENNFYEVLLMEIQQNEADLCFSGIHYHYAERVVSCKANIYVLGNREKLIKKLLAQDKYIINAVWNRLYKRSILENIVFPEGKYYEDVYFTTLVFSRVQKFIMTSETAYNYVARRPDSIMNNIVPENHILDAINFYEKRAKFLRDNLFGDDLLKAADIIEYKNLLRALRDLYVNTEIKNKKIIVRRILKYLYLIKSRKFVNANVLNITISLIKMLPGVLAWIIGKYMKKKGM